VLFKQKKGISVTIYRDVFFDNWNAAKRKGLVNAIGFRAAAKFGSRTKCKIRIRHSLNIIISGSK
jgi:hypothetical protein